MVRRLLLLPTCVLAGCGLADVPSGVASVDAERTVQPVVVTMPPTTIGRPDAPADVAEVETIVEPEVPVLPASIAVVGDSLTLSASDEIADALAALDIEVVAIDALESRRMVAGGGDPSPGVDAIEDIRTVHEPGLWVIALGTNDVASAGSLDGFRDDMREVLRAIPADAPVIWVDLWIAGREEAISRANLRIRAELGGRTGGAAVVDWFSNGEVEGIITADGVHLTAAGQLLFADAIVAAVNELFPTR